MCQQSAMVSKSLNAFRSNLVLPTKNPLSVPFSRMAEAGDPKIINGSESISLADILDNEAEEIGSRKLFAMEDENVDDDENALPARPEGEGFCVECEGTLFLPRSTLPEILPAPYAVLTEGSFSSHDTVKSLTDFCRSTCRAAVRNMRRHLLLCVLPFSAPERESETACHQIPERGPTTQKAKT